MGGLVTVEAGREDSSEVVMDQACGLATDLYIRAVGCGLCHLQAHQVYIYMTSAGSCKARLQASGKRRFASSVADLWCNAALD